VPAPASQIGLGAFGTSINLATNRLQAMGVEFLDWPLYVIVLYQANGLGAGAWSPWQTGIVFTGHFLRWEGDKPVYSSPDDDMVAYLDGLVDGGKFPGFWAAYYVVAQRSWTKEDGNSATISGYGQVSPWMTGRFGGGGAMKALNTTGVPGVTAQVEALAKWLGYATEARVTQHVKDEAFVFEKPLR